MTTTAATWFYREPEHNAYALEERLRTNFWDERLYDIWLSAVEVKPPFKMRGAYRDSTVEMEWTPNRQMVLKTRPRADGLADTLARMLRMKPFLRFDTSEGDSVWEWYADEAEGKKRWQAIQGRAIYRRPERLDTKGE